MYDDRFIEKDIHLRTLEIDYWSETKRYEKGICIYYVPCNKCSSRTEELSWPILNTWFEPRFQRIEILLALHSECTIKKCHLSSFAIHNAHKIVHRLERRVPQIREVDEKIGAKLPGTATPQRSGVTHTLFSHPSDYLWGSPHIKDKRQDHSVSIFEHWNCK